MSVQNRESKRDQKEERGKVTREFHEDVRCLRSEDIFRHPTTKGGPKAFALRALHQDHEDHDDSDDRPGG
jgi:hypothetical protein